MTRTASDGQRVPLVWFRLVTELLGLIAGVLTTGCWLPQVVRSIRTRRLEDFSWPYLGLLALGILLWLVYGLIREDPIIVGSNGMTLALLFVLVVLKTRSVPDQGGAATRKTPRAFRLQRVRPRFRSFSTPESAEAAEDQRATAGAFSNAVTDTADVTQESANLRE